MSIYDEVTAATEFQTIECPVCRYRFPVMVGYGGREHADRNLGRHMLREHGFVTAAEAHAMESDAHARGVAEGIGRGLAVRREELRREMEAERKAASEAWAAVLWNMHMGRTP